MVQKRRLCPCSILALTVLAGAAQAQPAPIETDNPVLQASLDRIAKGSSLWRDAVAAVGESGRRIVVLTPEQVSIVDASGQSRDPIDGTLLAEAAPIVRHGTKVDTVIVLINVALLKAGHDRYRSLPIEFDMDVDRLMVHEVYGHAIPYLLAGDVSGRCPDPRPKEAPAESCSIQRENAVRAELGLGRRVDSGLYGLNLTRRSRR